MFNVSADPSNYSDLASARPADVARLTAVFRARVAARFHPPQTLQDAAACRDKVVELGGYMGPYYVFGPGPPWRPPPPLRATSFDMFNSKLQKILSIHM